MWVSMKWSRLPNAWAENHMVVISPRKFNQIKLNLSHAPNTKSRSYREMLTLQALNQQCSSRNRVKKIFTKKIESKKENKGNTIK